MKIRDGQVFYYHVCPMCGYIVIYHHTPAMSKKVCVCCKWQTIHFLRKDPDSAFQLSERIHDSGY